MPQHTVKRAEFEQRFREVDAPDSAIALRSVLATCPADAKPSQGPLAEIAVLIKDNIEAVGLPGSAGSLALAAHPAKRDAELVRRLRAAGADIVGASNLSEWANIRSTRSASGWSAVGGLTANPWRLDRSAGGSSSGSGAAVAAGLVSLAIGSETDGSIVCPASLNGVVGLKPTVGSIPTHGVVPISGSQDTPGPLANDVRLAAAAFEVMAGRSGVTEVLDESDQLIKNLRIGVAEQWLTHHAETDAVFEETVEVLKHIVHEVSTSAVPAASEEAQEDEYLVLKAELKDDLASYLSERLGEHELNSLQAVIDFNREHADLELSHFGQEIFEAAVKTGGRQDPAYIAARKRNLEWASKQCFGPAFERHDLLVSPTYGPAWKSDLAIGENHAGGAVTTPAAIAGLPLLCIPMGLVRGLPVGLTISGPADSEPLLLALGEALMRRLGTRQSDGFRPQFDSNLRG